MSAQMFLKYASESWIGEGVWFMVASPLRLGRCVDRSADTVVGRAAADVPGHRLVDVGGDPGDLEDRAEEGSRHGTLLGLHGKAAGALMPATANCYSCHQEHGVVDTTFVQFYPTLMPIAKDKGTLIADYLKEVQAK